MKEEVPLHNEDLDKAYRVAYLLAGHIRKTLTSLEREELDQWLEESEENIELFEELTDEENVERALAWYAELDRKRKGAMYERLRKQIPFTPSKSKRVLRLLPLSIAAAVFVVVGAGIVVWMKAVKPDVSPPTVAQTVPTKDAAPAGDKALLRLGDGRTIVLDSAANGELAVQNGARVEKRGGSLVYDAAGAPANGDAVYHQLQTPRGGQYSLTLSDGTRVWLNAGSALRFPASFSGKARRVELQGEGYFEVMHKKEQPFEVVTGEVVIQDLGTAFNVNGYGDEGGVQTTLVEGVVNVQYSGQERRLRPGETAITRHAAIQVERERMEEAVGWRKGQFVFQNTLFSTVMKELERWYNVEIENKSVSTEHLHATLDRRLPLSKVLQLLEGQGALRYRWEGGKVVVTK